MELLLSLLFSCSVVSDSLQLHGLQHARLPCPSVYPGICSNSSPLSWWCHILNICPGHPYNMKAYVQGKCQKRQRDPGKCIFLITQIWRSHTGSLTSHSIVWGSNKRPAEILGGRGEGGSWWGGKLYYKTSTCDCICTIYHVTVDLKSYFLKYLILFIKKKKIPVTP